MSNWILEGHIEEKLKRFTGEPILWVFLFLFFYGMLSLLWSTNVEYGIHDLRVKLPLLVVPLVMATSSPIPKKYFYIILYLFLGTAVFTSVWNYFQFKSHISEVSDIRQMSRFISHVRLSILINFALFFTYYLVLKRKLNLLILIPVILWLLFYLYQSQVVNGYGLFLILILLTFIYWVYHLKNKILQKLISLVFILSIIVIIIGIITLWRNAKIEVPNVDYANLELYTANGNGYYHQKNTKITEDGKLVYMYISEKESRPAWAKLSDVHFDSLDRKGQPIAGTIYRYMTSKGLRKDSIGFLSLTNTDVQNIENGFSNFKINRGLSEKIRDLKTQFFMLKSNGDPNGNSLIQRQLHLLAAGSILQGHWLFGVGVGDVQLAFSEAYQLNDSLLKVENQHRSHNQFLTIWISHGLIGFITLILLWFIPFITHLKTCDYLLCVVLLAFGFSFLWQDMLETQAGVTIFALFYSLMVFKSRKNVTD
ncbi:MAG: O-antigen ligase family protein [Crocinitomicaceae bacterium]